MSVRETDKRTLHLNVLPSATITISFYLAPTVLTWSGVVPFIPAKMTVLVYSVNFIVMSLITTSVYVFYLIQWRTQAV